jgi:hypothetical protein
MSLPTGMLKALVPVFDVFEHGESKHGDEWRTRGDRVDVDHAITHLTAHCNGVLTDDTNEAESGLPHLAHVIARLLFVLARAEK